VSEELGAEGVIIKGTSFKVEVDVVWEEDVGEETGGGWWSVLVPFEWCWCGLFDDIRGKKLVIIVGFQHGKRCCATKARLATKAVPQRPFTRATKANATKAINKGHKGQRHKGN